MSPGAGFGKKMTRAAPNADGSETLAPIKKIRNYSYSAVTNPLVIKELIFCFLVITRGLFMENFSTRITRKIKFRKTLHDCQYL